MKRIAGIGTSMVGDINIRQDKIQPGRWHALEFDGVTWRILVSSVEFPLLLSLLAGHVQHKAGQ